MMLPHEIEDQSWIVIGRFGRPHGIKGCITIVSFTEPRENILHYMPWYANINQIWKPLNILRTEINHKFVIAQVDGYPTREQVACLTNVNIAIQSHQLPQLKAGEYYWHQLIGMQVVNPQGAILGHVTEMMTTGAHDVLVVTGEKRYLIPFLVDKYILQIDDQQRLITADWDADFT